MHALVICMYLHVILTGVVEYAGVDHSHKEVVQKHHDVVQDGQTDEQKCRRRESFVLSRPEHHRRHHVACNDDISNIL